MHPNNNTILGPGENDVNVCRVWEMHQASGHLRRTLSLARFSFIQSEVNCTAKKRNGVQDCPKMTEQDNQLPLDP